MSIMLNVGDAEHIELALVQRQLRLAKTQSLWRWHLFYGLFSGVDLLLTMLSFCIGGIEMNPIANWLFDQFGASSLITYKAMMVVLIFIQLSYIGKYKLVWAKRIYTFGIGTLVVVSTLSLCQIFWFVYEYSWGIFVNAIRYAF